MYRCIIIDDDQHAIENLQKFIVAYSGLEVIATYSDSLLALTSISKAEPVDLILLDVDMPKINGIELSKEIRSKTNKLIFTTAHTKYAYDAFKVQADDYLLKPFTIGEFMISMNKIFSERPNSEPDDFFFVKNKEDNHKMMNIKFKDVIAVESKLNYVMIHTATARILTYMSLNEISKLLKGHPNFVQFNRSFIISHNHIDFFDGSSIKMINGIQFTVGDYYRKSFVDFVNKHLLKAERK